MKHLYSFLPPVSWSTLTKIRRYRWTTHVNWILNFARSAVHYCACINRSTLIQHKDRCVLPDKRRFTRFVMSDSGEAQKWQMRHRRNSTWQWWARGDTTCKNEKIYGDWGQRIIRHHQSTKRADSGKFWPRGPTTFFRRAFKLARTSPSRDIWE
jgi:hypothetical protein